ncbi:LysR family transcriptional regulator [Roseomonas sp. 1311]|uniref:LysR family transcriptional regulator n=1 Tax=Roseomonas marmotae TaxID=2768161 RepID=A0ABS3KA86_9PROT|nr:LysR family transcriptional regulator [Roseomonas marmotae]
MELRHLRAFLAVAETLHFSRAAERLGISPPALTEQVQGLEVLLGVRLFRRTKRSVALTDAGQLFLRDAGPALEQVERAERTGRLAGRAELGIVNVGFAASAAFSGLLGASVAAWRQAQPQVELRLQELESIPQLEALGEGRLDIGFIRPPPVLPDGVATLVLLREPLWLALPQQHPLSAQTAIRVEELADEPFVTPDAEMSTGFYHHTLSLGRRAGFTPRLVHHGRDLVAVAALVALGIGVALVPDSLRESLRLPGLTYRPLAGEPLHAELAAAFRRNEAAPATRAFIRQLRRQARSAAG